MSDHGAGVAYREARVRIQQELCTGYHAVLLFDRALAELEHELAGVAKTLAIALGERLDQEYRAIAAEAELERVKLKLIFIEEWFDNLYPTDYDLCMKRWAEREAQ